MSSQGRPNPLHMKSLYYAVLLAMITTLSLSFLAFRAISDRLERSSITPTFDRFDELELESARDTLQNRGPQALSNYLTRLDNLFGRSRHYLLDANGKDMVTGENRHDLLPPPPADKSRIQAHGEWIVTHRSSDGQYWFAAVGTLDRPHLWTFLPYYFLVIGATGALCWLASAAVVSPIRGIATSIALFGQGNLFVRVNSQREDEIGQLGRSFDQMAERLQRLIVSERRLLGDISHEIRSPLARLKFAVKLARTSPDSNAALDRIERDVDRINALVADIVEITLVEGDPAAQGIGIVRVRDLIDDIVHDCSVEAEIRGCRIDLSGPLDGEILGNRELLRRAIENVLRNAIRYSPPQSAIGLSTSEEDGAVQIVIRDQGPGVPERDADETLRSIFSRRRSA